MLFTTESCSLSKGKKKILVNFKEVKRYSNIGKNQFIAKVLNHKDNG